MSDAPPAVVNIKWSADPVGVWLTWTPAVGNPVTILVPNRMLANLGKVLSARAAVVSVDRVKEGD